MAGHILVASFLAIACALATAYEPTPYQDFCVADPASSVKLNGFACLDPKIVEAKHFSFSGLNIPGNTSNPIGIAVTPAGVSQIPGLNTLGITLARVDYAPSGVAHPHYHPRATEIITVLEGSLSVGFVTSFPENRLISKVLQKGDVFVIPIGLVHYQANAGNETVVSIAALNSQNPGIVAVTNSIFGSNPPIDDDYLAKVYNVDKTIVEKLKAPYSS